MKIRSVKQLGDKLNGKKVLWRADFNMPIKNGVIKDEFKLVSHLSTLRFLLRYGAKVIVLTHLGRPDKDEQPDKGAYSTRPIARRLSELLGREVSHVNDVCGWEAGTAVGELAPKGVLMLENVRFEAGEKKNDKKLAKKLASFADFYVCDAFGASHRAHASVAAIKEFLPAYAGLLLEAEVTNLEAALHPRLPLYLVLGGAKVGTKTPLLKRLYPKAEKVLLGGALANNFLSARDYGVGKSLVDEQSVKFARSFGFEKLVLPEDVVVSHKQKSWEPCLRAVKDVRDDEYIFDIGPKTIKLYSHFIRKAGTIIWNGPLGLYEENSFRHGTLAVAKSIASRSRGQAFGVAGGGETVDALRLTGMLEYMDWVSTGGGAMLSYLGGEKMPGLKGLVN